MRARYFVGVSGFSYPSWKGRFYPRELKAEEFLGHYASALDSVEINSSFYAAPGAATVKGWAARTGEGFKFSFKAPRQVTHVLRLGEGAPEATGRLSETLDLLGTRRGPVLFQLPPYAKLDPRLLERFLTKTEGMGDRVFEFRNGSWLVEDTFRLLEEHSAGFCIADTTEMEPSFRVTGRLAYFRLRKDRYDAAAVDSWARKIRDAADGAAECYAYLRHDETGENALLAQRLSERLKV